MTETPRPVEPVTLSLKGTAAGAWRILPIAVFVLPFGIAYGIAAVQVQMTGGEALAMSALVFAGAAQFAALDFWSAEIDLLALLAATAALNARHVLMGATLYPWLRQLSPLRRYLAAAWISDANWAFATRAHDAGEGDVGLLLGSGMAMWLIWIAGTVLGTAFVAALPAPERFGVDVVFIAFFAILLVGLWQGRQCAVPWGVAAVAALLAAELLPAGWHVLSGGLAGAIAGVFWHDK